MNIHLDFLLRIAAAAQFAIALLNLFLVRIMNWKPDLEKAPLLIREVFHVHCLFISFALSIFAALTWRFAGDMATAASPIFVWLAAAIGLFWLARSVMQWLHYSSVHWRGHTLRTMIHWTLFLGYGALAGVYLIAACGKNR
jgi:hypothetical protein